MKKDRGRRFKFRPPPLKSQPAPFYTLDRFSLADLKRWNKRSAEVKELFLEVYQTLSGQRAKITEELTGALSQNTSEVKLTNWYRVVDLLYSHNPLSAFGSIKNEAGGRFNIGSIDEIQFQKFSALYIAEDFETAYRERFGANAGEDFQGLKTDEISLSAGRSFTAACVSGEIKATLDITDKTNLRAFVDCTRKFTIPNRLFRSAQKLKIPFPKPGIITDVEMLLGSFYQENWRQMPELFGVPANSQIFGQFVRAAGIEAIQYESTKNRKKCISIFPENFQQSDSFIEVHNPSSLTLNPKLDKHTCGILK